jgi:hypothetical protein
VVVVVVVVVTAAAVMLASALALSTPAEYARAVFEFQQREQDVLGPDVVVAHPQGLPET